MPPAERESASQGNQPARTDPQPSPIPGCAGAATARQNLRDLRGHTKPGPAPRPLAKEAISAAHVRGPVRVLFWPCSAMARPPRPPARISPIVAPHGAKRNAQTGLFSLPLPLNSSSAS